MEEINSDLLLTPSAKKNCKFNREYPFPIVTRDCKENEPDPAWKIAEGDLEKNCVLVRDEKSMKNLYFMGFFGKGTLSKNAPKICSENSPEAENPKLRSTTSSPVDEIIVVDSDDDDSKPGVHHDDVIFISDSSDNDICFKENSEDQLESEEKESLQLTFQEAFFLSYGLGCLIVKEKGKLLNLSSLWIKFCELTPSGNFPVMYTAYHHFRSKGWIVKGGLKFGTDYVLYKDGPPFYHATYSVIVRAVSDNLQETSENRELTWSSLAALNRVNNTAGKGLLILYVIRPWDLIDEFLYTPLCISKFKLEEVFLKRWVASENRESTGQEIEDKTS